jgi:hypothetical protein
VSHPSGCDDCRAQIEPGIFFGRSAGLGGYCVANFAGVSITGLRSKNPSGQSFISCHFVGSTGQSSGRGMWWKPIVYQAAMSVFSIGWPSFTKVGRPSPPSADSDRRRPRAPVPAPGARPQRPAAAICSARRRSVSARFSCSEATIAPTETTAMMIVQMALICGDTPRRTWL